MAFVSITFIQALRCAARRPSAEWKCSCDVHYGTLYENSATGRKHSERAQERRATLTSTGYKRAFLPSSALRHSNLQISSRYRPIARDRRGSLLGHFPVGNACQYQAASLATSTFTGICRGLAFSALGSSNINTP